MPNYLILASLSKSCVQFSMRAEIIPHSEGSPPDVRMFERTVPLARSNILTCLAQPT